jgi:hypothetical protein
MRSGQEAIAFTRPARWALYLRDRSRLAVRSPNSVTSPSFRPCDRLTAAAIFATGLGYFASFRPWTRPVLLDAATWDYMAIETARGLVPYRDIFLHKTPGSALLGALGATIGKLLGLEPVLTAHALFLVFGSLAPVLLFLICRHSMPRAMAFAIAIALLGYDEWAIAALEGCRPKVATVMLGLASMLAAETGAAFSASLLGGLSVLCWQPGLAFLFGAWTVIFRDGERRIPRWFAIAATSLVPSILLLCWLAAHGALQDFLDQAVLFNLTYISEKARTPLGTLKAFARTIGEWNLADAMLMPAVLAGLWGMRGQATSTTVGAQPARLPLSILVSGAVYTAMAFISYQSWPDAILLGPLVATLIGAGLHALLRLSMAPRAALTMTLLVLMLAALPDDKAKFHPPTTFTAQRERFRSLEEGLGPNDTVIGVSVPEFFLHTGRRNGWKWPYLWFGVDEFAATHHAGGFAGLLKDLERKRPKLMLVGRLWTGPERKRFEEWAAARYDVTSLRIFPHTKRPLRVYRLKG